MGKFIERISRVFNRTTSKNDVSTLNNIDIIDESKKKTLVKELNLEDIQAKIIYTESYSEFTSIILFLQSQNFKDNEISEIMSSNNRIQKITDLYTHKNSSNNQENILSTVNEIVIQYKTIVKDYHGFLRCISLWIAYSINATFGCNVVEKGYDETPDNYFYRTYKKKIEELLIFPNEINNLTLYINKNILGCIALYQKRNSTQYIDIVDTIYGTIATANDNIFTLIRKYIPLDILKNIIICNTNRINGQKFSMSYLLKKDEKIDTTNINNQLFDINNLIQDNNRTNRYYLKFQSDKNIIENTLLELNKYIDEASHILHHKLTKISIKDLFFATNENQNGTFLEYHPLTPTGKASKYPYTLFFHTYFTDDDTFYSLNIAVVGRVYYLNNGNIGKAVFTCWQNNKGITVSLAVKNKKLIVNKITKTLNNGKKKSLYKFEDNVKN